MGVNIIATNFKIFLKKIGKTQEMMATETGFSLTSISRYARGKRTPDCDFIQKLIIKYDLNANWLVTGKGEMFLNENKSKEDLKKLTELFLDEEGNFRTNLVKSLEGLLRKNKKHID
jgi:transcriptional regulator with XRE-family HTH domain